MFLSREIYLKLCQNYKKIHIYIYIFKQIIFSKYATNLKTIIFHRSLRLSGLLLLFLFCILIDIFDNIIAYSPNHVNRTSANGSGIYWSRDTDGNLIMVYFWGVV